MMIEEVSQTSFFRWFAANIGWFFVTRQKDWASEIKTNASDVSVTVQKNLVKMRCGRGTEICPNIKDIDIWLSALEKP